MGAYSLPRQYSIVQYAASQYSMTNSTLSHLTPRAGVPINGKAKLRVVLDHGLDSTDCLIGIEFVEFLRLGKGVLYLAEVQNLALGGFPPFGFLFVELGELSLLHVFHVTHGNYSMY
jgi:hypothetical protein